MFIAPWRRVCRFVSSLRTSHSAGPDTTELEPPARDALGSVHANGDVRAGAMDHLACRWELPMTGGRSAWRPNWPGVIAGALIAAIAFSLSVSSYENASRNGGIAVVLWGAIFVGAALALRSLFRTTGSIQAEAARRLDAADRAEWERRAPTIRWVLGEEWTQRAAGIRAEHGASFPDWAVARLMAAENREREAERAAAWRANAAAAYAPVVAELRATMTARAWEARRRKTTDQMRLERADDRLNWYRRQAIGTRESRPSELDPAATPPAEDWQIAARIRPMQLDEFGNPAGSVRLPT